MAQAYTVPPILRLKRSTQSGNFVMTAAWQTVYANDQLYAWMFGSGRIDLTNMVAGDAIEIRVSTRNESLGAYIVEDLFDYLDAQPTGKQKIVIGPIVDTFGVLIEMRQTAVAVDLITCYSQFFDAIR